MNKDSFKITKHVQNMTESVYFETLFVLVSLKSYNIPVQESLTVIFKYVKN